MLQNQVEVARTKEGVRNETLSRIEGGACRGECADEPELL